ncbi:MAG TPA: dihydrodipicolinate synthase family protein [Thermohalobaculum sp.]|nr:dihydrodipicolinate synthase family protein [Thermohalobaculum sp.]
MSLIERFGGIHAATVCPMTSDFGIDEDTLAAHVRTVASVPGIRGLLINGHAGENFVLTRSEMRHVIEVVRATVGPDCWLTAGVNAESSIEAGRIAADAEAEGANALLVFPPNSWALNHDLGIVRAHHEQVLDATGLPLVLYQAPVGAGRMAYALPTVQALIEIPRVAAIKEGSWELATYEQNWRAVKARRPDIAVLGSGDEHLLTSYLIGSDGAQVSLAAVVPELIVALDAAARAGDWAEARALHERIYPLSVAIYRRPPSNRATARLKKALELLGRIPRATARPPIQELPAEECSALEDALRHALG